MASDNERIYDKLDELVKGQACTNTWAQSIDSHLRTLNGKVASQERRIVDIETAEKVRAATKVAVEKATTKVVAKYERWLVPALKYLIAAIIVLILERGPQILKALKMVSG